MYRLFVLIFVISSSIMASLRYTKTESEWIPALLAAAAIFGYFGGICILGYYEFHDPQQSYKCRACGHTTIIARAPYSFFEKFMFGFFGALFLIVVVLLVALYFSAKNMRTF